MANPRRKWSSVHSCSHSTFGAATFATCPQLSIRYAHLARAATGSAGTGRADVKQATPANTTATASNVTRPITRLLRLRPGSDWAAPGPERLRQLQSNKRGRVTPPVGYTSLRWPNDKLSSGGRAVRH